MKTHLSRLIMSIALIIGFVLNLSAQDEKETYQFTDTKVVKVTAPKDQCRAGTCWSYSTLGFIEAEMLRLGKEEVDLSEPYVFRMAYEDKAEKYVRMHGTMNFGGGGAVNDPIDVIVKYGMVPEEAYTGLNYGTDIHVHGEIENVLKAYLDAVIEDKNKTLSTAWFNGYKGILAAYFGAIPEKFNYKGKEYTPRTFADKVLGIKAEDYVYLTSYTHHPFYKQFAIEVQDNWSWQKFYNLPIDELIAVFDNAIDKGFTIGWASDISEKGFSSKKGVAVVPADDIAEMDGMEMNKWESMTAKEKQNYLYSFDKILKEKTITQEMRQLAFDNYQTTDDHGMVIMGKATDQKGNEYYKVKNSWGTNYNEYGGYFYASKAFVKYKTMSCVIHKDAIPKEIKAKLGL